MVSFRSVDSEFFGEIKVTLGPDLEFLPGQGCFSVFASLRFLQHFVNSVDSRVFECLCRVRQILTLCARPSVDRSDQRSSLHLHLSLIHI